MPSRRSLVAALVACASIAGVVAAPASAARPVGYPDTVSSAHFLVHYTGDGAATDRVNAQVASDVDATAERAYTAITQSYGFPAPLDDGDGKIDIWIASIGLEGVLGVAVPDTASNQSSGYIQLDPPGGIKDHVIAHELFHLVQFGIWAPADGWLLESTAEWAGFRFESFPADSYQSLGAPDMSLDCIGDKCGDDDYERGGYSRWSFFEYLQERFGSSIVKSIFDRGATVADPTVSAVTLLSDALAAKGTTLANVFTDWTVANLYGDYTAVGLKGVLPPAYTTISTGAKTATLPSRQVSVDHLAARYVAFSRGDSGTGPCYAATLTVNVTLPAGSTARPYFYWPELGATPKALAISGSSAAITVPWDTCTWPYSGYLVLQNPSTTADAQLFTVSSSVGVDKTTPAVAAAPPPPIKVPGTVVPAPASDPAPKLTLHAPELLRVSSRDRVLRFVVYSTGEGALEATLGGTPLGEKSLRTGNNDVRFVLPATVFAGLRKPASSNVLRLTSFSPSGAEGATITRAVAVQKATKKSKKR